MIHELALLVASVFLGKCTNYQVIFQIFTIEAQEKNTLAYLHTTSQIFLQLAVLQRTGELTAAMDVEK